MGSDDKTYEVLEPLARGGMGEVLLARERAGDLFERLVVLKVVLREYAEDEEFDTAFLDEARLASQLQHPNIAQIYDVARLDGRPCIVMEWLRGRDLGRILKALTSSGQLMEPRILASILLGTVAGLGYAHRAVDSRGQSLGLVHRDISPQNVILTYDGIVKVIDFGIALSRNRMTKTATGLLKGKVPYMAPEQLRGKRMDHRTDLWALGVVAWECLTGQRLFRPRADFDVIGAVIEMEVPRPSDYRPEIPASIDRIVMRMLERDPDARIQSCEELERELLGASEELSLPTPNELGAWLRGLLPEERASSSVPQVEAAAPGSTLHLSPAMPSKATATLPGPAGGAPPGEGGAETARQRPSQVDTTPRAQADGPVSARGDSGVPGTSVEQPVPADAATRAGPARADTEPATPQHQPAPATARPDATPAQVPVAHRGARWGWWLLGAALVIGGAAGAAAALISRGSDEPAAAEQEPAPEAAASVASPPSDGDGQPQTVRFEVEGLPEGGSLALDGEPREGATVEVPKGDTVHELQIRDADGEVVDERQLRASADTVVAVSVMEDEPEQDAADRPRTRRRSGRGSSRRSARRAGSGSTGQQADPPAGETAGRDTAGSGSSSSEPASGTVGTGIETDYE